MNTHRVGARSRRKDGCEHQRNHRFANKNPNADFGRYRIGDNGLCAWTRWIDERRAHLKFDMGNELK